MRFPVAVVPSNMAVSSASAAKICLAANENRSRVQHIGIVTASRIAAARARRRSEVRRVHPATTVRANQPKVPEGAKISMVASASTTMSRDCRGSSRSSAAGESPSAIPQTTAIHTIALMLKSDDRASTKPVRSTAKMMAPASPLIAHRAIAAPRITVRRMGKAVGMGTPMGMEVVISGASGISHLPLSARNRTMWRMGGANGRRQWAGRCSMNTLKGHPQYASSFERVAAGSTQSNISNR